MGKKLKNAQKLALVLATGFGTGYCPGAPGTAGAALGLVVGWLLGYLSPALSLFMILFLVMVGIWAGGVTEKTLGQKDPAIIVIDEIAGMTISVWHVDTGWTAFIVLFFLFRLFDIWKPFPVKNMEDMFPGGAGIMMDDVMAGIYANIIWRLGSLFF